VRRQDVGLKVTHVPYRGAARALQDLIAGRIDYQRPDIPIAIAQIQSKTVEAIAVLTRDRSASLPALATAHEQGLTNFAASNWFAVFLPKGAPPAIIQKLRTGIVAVLDTPAAKYDLAAHREVGYTRQSGFCGVRSNGRCFVRPTVNTADGLAHGLSPSPNGSRQR
jgi:tripartite-type tricarboxylate transporter receptor subunit TctC